MEAACYLFNHRASKWWALGIRYTSLTVPLFFKLRKDSFCYRVDSAFLLFILASLPGTLCRLPPPSPFIIFWLPVLPWPLRSVPSRSWLRIGLFFGCLSPQRFFFTSCFVLFCLFVRPGKSGLYSPSWALIRKSIQPRISKANRLLLGEAEPPAGKSGFYCMCPPDLWSRKPRFSSFPVPSGWKNKSPCLNLALGQSVTGLTCFFFLSYFQCLS